MEGKFYIVTLIMLMEIGIFFLCEKLVLLHYGVINFIYTQMSQRMYSKSQLFRLLNILFMLPSYLAPILYAGDTIMVKKF